MNKDLNTTIQNLLDEVDAKYGIIFQIDNKIVFEKYIGNNKNTKFRIFSCTKPITGMAIMLLAQANKLKLNDTIDKYSINIPYNNIITIKHLLHHKSGIYDSNSNILFKHKPKKLFDSLIDLKSYSTKFMDFATEIEEINKNKPNYKPNKLLDKCKFQYNNTGYDILGYIIFVVTGLKTNAFIQKHIFDKLKMKDTCFHHDLDKNESIPYDNNGKIAMKEQQDWYNGNANVSCTLRDYLKFLNGYQTLLKNSFLQEYHDIYYFAKTNKGVKFHHFGGGDFAQYHIKHVKYWALSQTSAIRYKKHDKDIKLIIAENYNKGGYSLIFNEGFTTPIWNKFYKVIEEL